MCSLVEFDGWVLMGLKGIPRGLSGLIGTWNGIGILGGLGTGLCGSVSRAAIVRNAFAVRASLTIPHEHKCVVVRLHDHGAQRTEASR